MLTLEDLDFYGLKVTSLEWEEVSNGVFRAGDYLIRQDMWCHTSIYFGQDFIKTATKMSEAKASCEADHAAHIARQIERKQNADA